MPLVVLFFIWYFMFGRNNPKFYNKISSMKKWIKWLFVLLIISNISSGLFEVSLGLAGVILPIYIISKIFKAIFKPEEVKERKEAKKARNEAIPKSEQLPNSVPKRLKIVEKFNKQYGLNLTDQQIQTIVDSSYVSTDWEYLILSMLKEYPTIHVWFKSPIGGWLRTYLKVFNIQQISSDMTQQKQICLQSFNQIFSSVDLSSYNTPAWDIRKINNQYMTNFDDISFMIAYRFLEANGYKYNLGSVEILNTDAELNDLRKKYEDSPATMLSPGRMP